MVEDATVIARVTENACRRTRLWILHRVNVNGVPTTSPDSVRSNHSGGDAPSLGHHPAENLVT